MTFVRGVIRGQLALTRRDIDDLTQIVLIPLFAVVFIAMVLHSGRREFLGYALVAPLLIAIGQMAFFAAGNVVASERWRGTFELTLAAPSHFTVVAFLRVAVVSTIGFIGFFESWGVARLVFGLTIPIEHPEVFAATLLAIAFATSATALVFAALQALSRSTITLRNSVTYPFYLLGGVLVPAALLPEWIQPVSKLVYLSWAADLLRESLAPPPVADVPARLLAILALGCVAAAIGSLMLARITTKLRRDGDIGL